MKPSVRKRWLSPSAILVALTLALGTVLAASADGPGEYLDVTPDPVAFQGLSSLAAGPGDGVLHAVPDNAIKPSRIFRLKLDNNRARVVSELLLTKDGNPVSYDLEGIAVRPKSQDGWWVVSEGAGNAPCFPSPTCSPNLLIQVNSDGSVAQEVTLPSAVAAQQRQFGFEGVATNKDGSQVYVAFQRPWGNDPADRIKIGRYTPGTGQWAFFHYPKEPDLVHVPADLTDRRGLSEIRRLDDDTYMVIDRDDKVASNPDGSTRFKRIYAFSVAGVTPVADPAPSSAGGVLPLLSKVLVRDLVVEDSYPHRRPEGMAIHGKDVLVVNDNGVSPPESTRMLRLKKLAKDAEKLVD
jgi:hypothetical protein